MELETINQLLVVLSLSVALGIIYTIALNKTK
jgi:hypothetical protein